MANMIADSKTIYNTKNVLYGLLLIVLQLTQSYCCQQLWLNLECGGQPPKQWQFNNMNLINARVSTCNLSHSYNYSDNKIVSPVAYIVRTSYSLKSRFQ